MKTCDLNKVRERVRATAPDVRCTINISHDPQYLDVDLICNGMISVWADGEIEVDDSLRIPTRADRSIMRAILDEVDRQDVTP